MTVHEKLAGIREREQRATSAPWIFDQPWAGYSAIRSASGEVVFYTAATDLPNAENDHVFCAAARSDVPALLDLVEELLAALKNALPYAADSRCNHTSDLLGNETEKRDVLLQCRAAIAKAAGTGHEEEERKTDPATSGQE